MLDKQLRYHAKQSYKALLNPYQSVIKTFPEILDLVTESKSYYYVGLKDTATLSAYSISSLLSDGPFLLHTIDVSSPNGRAIDPHLKNPITTFPMTGSSSGTAVNVFLGINDLGIGTDGGGSVLAPALSLNLYSLMSPLLPLQDNVKSKQSTDGITFTPSPGLIAKDFGVIKKALQALNLYSEEITIPSKNSILALNNALEGISLPNTIKVVQENFDVLQARSELIIWLSHQLEQYDFIISKEGPIDFYGLGDSIIGHFDNHTQTFQKKSNKGLVRVVNMVGATAVTIPSSNLATGWVVITKSERSRLRDLVKLISQFPDFDDELIERYFGVE